MPVVTQNTTLLGFAVRGWFVPIGISHTAALLTLLSFAGSWHWYLETLGHFRVHYLVLLVICSTLFWLASKWKQAAYAVLLASANLMFVLPLYRVPAEVRPRGKQTPLSTDETKVSQWRGSIPNVDDMYQCKSYDELSKIVNDWLAGDDVDGPSFDTSSNKKDSAPAAEAPSGGYSNIDDAFADLEDI